MMVGNNHKIQAALALASRDDFSIHECCELAKDLGAFDTLEFDLVGPKGSKPAKWLDAYFGLLTIDGTINASMAAFNYASDIRCQNLRLPEGK